LASSPVRERWTRSAAFRLAPRTKENITMPYEASPNQTPAEAALRQIAEGLTALAKVAADALGAAAPAHQPDFDPGFDEAADDHYVDDDYDAYDDEAADDDYEPVRFFAATYTTVDGSPIDADTVVAFGLTTLSELGELVEERRDVNGSTVTVVYSVAAPGRVSLDQMVCGAEWGGTLPVPGAGVVTASGRALTESGYAALGVDTDPAAAVGGVDADGSFEVNVTAVASQDLTVDDVATLDQIVAGIFARFGTVETVRANAVTAAARNYQLRVTADTRPALLTGADAAMRATLPLAAGTVTLEAHID
jgi:hypothetical protein